MIPFLLKHYQLILIGLLAATIAFFVWDYYNTKTVLEATKADLVIQKQAFNQLRTDMDTYKGNVDRLDGVLNNQSVLVRKQTSVKERMNGVAVKNNDKIFTDPGLLNRAGIMRDYQKARAGESGGHNTPSS